MLSHFLAARVCVFIFLWAPIVLLERINFIMARQISSDHKISKLSLGPKALCPFLKYVFQTI